jgi:hypothetical protein
MSLPPGVNFDALGGMFTPLFGPQGRTLYYLEKRRGKQRVFTPRGQSLTLGANFRPLCLSVTEEEVYQSVQSVTSPSRTVMSDRLKLVRGTVARS